MIGAAAAADRTEAKREGIPVPTPMSMAVAPAALDAATPLPGGSVLWAAVASPPALGAAGGGMLLQGGGGGVPQLRYYALDALGSVRVVFDAAGQVVSRADYEPFGAAVPASTTGTLPRQQYTGHERDGEVGVDYFGARMYVPTLGRMPSVDPLYAGAVERPQRWNRYAYALNTPTAVIDPDGRCAEWTSDDAVNVCGTGGNASYTHPAYVQEHNPFLFLLMGYSNYGYSGGGSVDLGWSETPAAEEKGQVQTEEIVSSDCTKTVDRIVTDVERAVTTGGVARLADGYVNADEWGWPRGLGGDYFGVSNSSSGFKESLVDFQRHDVFRHLTVNMGAAMKGSIVGAAMHYATRGEAIAQFYTPGASANRRIEAISE